MHRNYCCSFLVCVSLRGTSLRVSLPELQLFPSALRETSAYPEAR